MMNDDHDYLTKQGRSHHEPPYRRRAVVCGHCHQRRYVPDGRWLRWYRRHHLQMTITQLSECGSLDPSILSRIERNLMTVRLETIARGYRISMQTLRALVERNA